MMAIMDRRLRWNPGAYRTSKRDKEVEGLDVPFPLIGQEQPLTMETTDGFERGDNEENLEHILEILVEVSSQSSKK